MQRVHVAFAIACTVGPGLVGSGASAQSTEAHEHPDVVVDSKSWRVQRSARADFPLRGATGPVSTTADNQLLVELTPDDTAPANLFDLDGRTLVFRPDGHGGYSRAVRSVAWEDDLGASVADGAEIQLESFVFDFAGRRWGSFFVSRHGLITFGEPFSYSYWDSENRFDTMSEIAGKFAIAPTDSPLYKPRCSAEDPTGTEQHNTSPTTPTVSSSRGPRQSRTTTTFTDSRRRSLPAFRSSWAPTAALPSITPTSHWVTVSSACFQTSIPSRALRS